jgi:predicted SAM-dependent methyltransferase
MESGARVHVKGLVKPLIIALNAPLARRRLHRELARSTPPLRIELGGIAPRPGWVVTNANWNTHLYLDATRPWPVEHGSVESVFADNMIEHLTLDQARAFLRNAHTALQPGGTIRLPTPDVEAAARYYLGEDEASAAAVLGMHRRAGWVAEHSTDLLRVPFTEHGHHVGYLYDEPSLSAELKRAGFHTIRRCATGQSEKPALRNLENRTDEESLVQLILEADA